MPRMTSPAARAAAMTASTSTLTSSRMSKQLAILLLRRGVEESLPNGPPHEAGPWKIATQLLARTMSALPALHFTARPRGAAPPRCRCPCVPGPPSSWHVPPSAFGGLTPERAAANQLARFFTHAAAFVVLDQLECVAGGTGELSVSRPLPPSSPGCEAEAEAAERLAADKAALAHHLQSVKLVDADAWLEALSQSSPRVALRVATTRLAYATEPTGFEWDNLKRVTGTLLSEGNAAWRSAWLRSAVAVTPQPDSAPAPEPGFRLPGLGRAPGGGRPQCAVCLGTGTKPCGQCEGTGVNQEQRFSSPPGAPCWLCAGAKRTMCGACVDMTDTF
jgi:hypothetical protein